MDKTTEKINSSLKDTDGLGREDSVEVSLQDALKVNSDIIGDRLLLLLGNGGEVFASKQCSDRDYVDLLFNFMARDPYMIGPTLEAIALACEALGIDPDAIREGLD